MAVERGPAAHFQTQEGWLHGSICVLFWQLPLVCENSHLMQILANFAPALFFKKAIKIIPPTSQVGFLTPWAASSSFSTWSSFTLSFCLPGRCHPVPASKPLTAALCVALNHSSLMPPGPNSEKSNLQVKLNFQNEGFILCCC